jgi:quercetin dioxygenase-like cupin family protein
MPKTKAKQRFHVKHERRQDFDQGLRSYASYRDLGLAEPTTGMVQAHVIRMIAPCDPKVVSKWHYHDVNLQFIYVLKGWIKNEFEVNGVHTMKQGTCWLQPPKIRHRVLDYSADCELLEIVLPAKFDTVELED